LSPAEDRLPVFQRPAGARTKLFGVIRSSST
jgi:hypothetical protein